MNRVTSPLPRILAVHPNTRGMGWVLFEGPFRLVAWGSTHADKDVSAACLRKLDRLLSRYSPETLVLEAFEGRGSYRRSRVAALGRALVSAAGAHGVEVSIYRRAHVQTCFAIAGARTRHEIAEAVARYHAPLRALLPTRRALWEKEHPRSALFAAAALVLTHYHWGASDLLDDLSVA